MTNQLQLTVRDHVEAQRFEAVDADGTVAGFAAYRRSPGQVVFTHTEVGDAFEGQGVGSRLVRAALDAVRGEGQQVVAECPFVRSWIERHPEYADLT